MNSVEKFLKSDRTHTDVSSARNALTEMLTSLLVVEDISFELLMYIRDEIFCYLDVVYFTFLILESEMTKLKKLQLKKGVIANPLVIKNALDILRIISFEDVEFMIADEDIGKYISTWGLRGAGGSESEDSEDEIEVKQSAKPREKGQRLNRAEQIVTIDSQKKAFSSAWLSLFGLLSLNMQLPSNRIALKHLSEFVIPFLAKPIFLADYLTVSYQQGGINSILALESLFVLIVKYNLDYPQYFASLYALCEISVFNAKYKGKFLSLLHKSLRSTNLPAYVAAAFIKKLLYVIVQGGGSCARFCVTEAAMLLREHPQCISLIHRAQEQQDVPEKDKKPDVVLPYKEFNFEEFSQLEKCNGLNTSLFELEILKDFYLPEVRDLVDSFRENYEVTKLNTSVALSSKWDPASYLEDNYSSLIESSLTQTGDATKEENKKRKKMTYKDRRELDDDENEVISAQKLHVAAFNHRKATKLFSGSDCISSYFGNNV